MCILKTQGAFSPLFLVAFKIIRLSGVDREIFVTLKFRAKVLIAIRKSQGFGLFRHAYQKQRFALGQKPNGH